MSAHDSVPQHAHEQALSPPQPQFGNERNSYASSSTPYSDSVNSFAPMKQETSALIPDLHDNSSKAEEAGLASGGLAPQQRRRRHFPWWWIALIVLAVLLIAVAIVVPIYFEVIRPKTKGGKTGGKPSAADPDCCNPVTGKNGATMGGDGSTVIMEDGTSFVYRNSFGGYWVADPKDPLSGAARAQSFSPALNETWRWGVDQIRGVNLGGWLVTEPFITPALFQQFGAVDEWTLSQAMAANGGLSQLEDHYKTFITEQDFAEIAAAGLNWVRLPIPFWAIEVWDGEPFLERVSWTYVLKAIQWARKYGLRMNLDLHTCPGSQNAWNHSGKQGQINFLSGVMGIANAQRVLDYIRFIAEFISEPQYSDVVLMFGALNEPHLKAIGNPQVRSFYLKVHDTIRAVTGFGEGRGPFISIHDGFQLPSFWAGFLTGADRVALDRHPYFAFDGSANTDPIATYVPRPCTEWADQMNTSMTAFGFTSAGEFSAAINDCGLYVNGVNVAPTYGGDCSVWNNWETWGDGTKNSLKQFILSSMDALQHYFFWTWKIGNDSVTGTVQAPFWSYKLGLENGWVSPDPRDAIGMCVSNGVPADEVFQGAFQPWQTGGVGAGQIDPVQVQQYAWPPASITSAGAVALMPTYTPTKPIVTLPAPTFTAKGVDGGDGWFNDADTTSAMTTVAGCTSYYANAWDANTATMPAAQCTGAVQKRDAMPAMATPPPS